MALTPQQIQDYYKTQSSGKKPLSPAQYEAMINSQNVPKVGDLIPGSKLRYEAEDIINRADGIVNVPSPAPTLQNVPKVGDLIPGSKLRYEAEDIINLGYDGSRLPEFGASGKGLWNVPDPVTDPAGYEDFKNAVRAGGINARGSTLPPEGKYFDSKGVLQDINPPTGYYRNAEGNLVPNIKRAIYAPNTVQNVTTRSNITPRSTVGMTQEEIDASEYLDTSFEPPKTKEEIIAERTAQSKSRIDALNAYYASERANLAPLQEQRSREANAQAVLRGLSGSSEAGVLAETATKKNVQEQNALVAEQNMKLMSIYSDIQDFADRETIRQKEVATGTAEDILARGEAARARDEAAREEAISHLETIAKMPVFNLDTIKQNDPDTYYALAQSVGGEDKMKSIVSYSRPARAIVGTPAVMGEYMHTTVKNPDGTTSNEYTKLPQEVLDSIAQGKQPQYSESPQGTLVSVDGGKNWKSLSSMFKAFDERINGSESDKLLSTNQILQFKETYGWTPPFGFSASQLSTYIQDNPNATPAELEAGAKQVMEATTEAEASSTPKTVISFITENMTDAQKTALKKRADTAGISSMWKGAGTDIKNYLNSITAQIQEALDGGFTQEEIMDFLTK